MPRYNRYILPILTDNLAAKRLVFATFPSSFLPHFRPHIGYAASINATDSAAFFAIFLRENPKPPRILEVGEVVSIINVATNQIHKVVISLAYYHGLRRSEICNLQWQDVDFEQNRLFIADRDGARTKTRKSRAVALRQETATLLAELAKDRVNEYVFTNSGAFY